MKINYKFLVVIGIVMFVQTFVSSQEPIREAQNIPMESDYAEEFVDHSELNRKVTDNVACVLVYIKRKHGLEVNGELILPIQYELKKRIGNRIFVFARDGNEGVYDAENLRWIIPLDRLSIKLIRKDFFIISRGSNASLIDVEGKVLLRETRQSIEDAGSTDFFVVKRKKEKETRRSIFSVTEGEFILEFNYKNIAPISNSHLFRIKKKEGYRLYDPVENRWGKNKYDVILDRILSNKPRVIVQKDGLSGVIDMQERIVVPIEYRSVYKVPLKPSVVLQAKDNLGKIDVYELNGRRILEGVDEVITVTKDKLQIKKEQKVGLVTVIQDSIVVRLQPEYDEIQIAYGNTIVRSGAMYDVFCDKKPKVSLEFPYSKVQVLNNRTLLVTINGQVARTYVGNCEPSAPSVFTEVEDIEALSGSREGYNYLKAKKGIEGYFLVNGNLVLESQEVFTDLLRTKKHYVFFKNELGKVGVYDGLADVYVLEAIYDSVDFSGGIYLYKDSKKGRFSKGKVFFE